MANRLRAREQGKETRKQLGIMIGGSAVAIAQPRGVS